MSVYRFATGHDVALASLSAFSPQPRSIGVQTVERSYGLSSAVHEHGLYLELIWDAFETESLYQTRLSSFGLTSALYANVTIYARKHDYSWQRYNAVVARPQIGADAAWTSYFIRNVSFVFKNLEALAEP